MGLVARHPDAATLVFLGGICAALHIGKLPPALPVLGQALGITLVEAGFLLSMVQLAGVALGIAVGLVADGVVGPRRSMIAGLAILSLAGLLGGFADSAAMLLALRAAEGLGFLLAALPAPSLIRRLVPPAQLNLKMGLWGTFMPTGTALGLLAGPVFMAAAGWRAWWWLTGAVSLGMAGWLWRALPRSRDTAAAGGAAPRVPADWPQRLARTLRAPGPWLVSLGFAVYSGQWLAVIGFLPSIQAAMGLSGAASGALTAFAAGVNVVGSLASGRLLHRGVPAPRLLAIGFSIMGLATVATYASFGGEGLPASLRYAAVVVFSLVGGLIPGTLFALAVRLAPDDGTVSTTVGWMQQWSALGQFAVPPVVAWVASRAGGWQWTWVVTGTCAAAGLLVAAWTARVLARRPSGALRRSA